MQAVSGLITGLFLSRRTLLRRMAAATLLTAGCGQRSDSELSLAEDRNELTERRAIDHLREAGCQVEEVEDEWLSTSGILVRLAPEHIARDGTLLPPVFDEFRYIRKLFLLVDRTPVGQTGLGQLRSLDNLLLLSAQETPTSNAGLTQIEGIVSLRLLRLNWTGITDDGLRHIERLPDLVMLYLSGTKLSDAGLTHITPLKKLRAMQLAFTGLTDNGVAQLRELPALAYLGLDATRITDACIRHLSAMKTLQYLNLTRTAVTRDGLIELSAALPQCRVVQKPVA